MSSIISINPVLYYRESALSISSYSTAEGRRTIVVPKGSALVGSDVVVRSSQQTLDINNTALWDDAQYATAANRAGKDFYTYQVSGGGLILSANSTVPTGYTSSNSRKIAGFHCLCLSVGTISGHALTGFLTGDILPASIWDLQFRPSCAPEGMVYSSAADVWVDIYLQSGTGTSTLSAYAATITDYRSYWDHQDDLAAVGKRLLSDAEFSQIALGSPEQASIAGASDPVYTGGHRSTIGATNGTSTSASSPSTDISASASPQQLTVVLCGTAPVTVSFDPAGLNTGALIAAALQTAIRSAVLWAGGLTVTYGTTYVISCPGSFGTSASVVITSGGSNDCTAALKLGVTNGGVEVAGSLGRRMVSNIGCEDCAGSMYQWVDGGHLYRNHDTTYNGAWSWKLTGGTRGQQFTQGLDGVAGLLAGGGWSNGSYCGSRCRLANGARANTNPNVGSRGCARSKVIGG